MTKLPSVHRGAVERTKAVIFIFVDQGEAGVALRGRGVVEGAHDDKDHCRAHHGCFVAGGGGGTRAAVEGGGKVGMRARETQRAAPHERVSVRSDAGHGRAGEYHPLRLLSAGRSERGAIQRGGAAERRRMCACGRFICSTARAREKSFSTPCSAVLGWRNALQRGSRLRIRGAVTLLASVTTLLAVQCSPDLFFRVNLRAP